MTDDEGFDESDFDDPAYADIRDLLASARADEPIPAEVAARLDATLAELTGRTAGPAPAPADDATVVPLRRRSLVGPRLLAAAAVIVVAGAGAVGLNQVVQNTSSNDSASPKSATAAQDSGGSLQPEAAPTPLPSLSGTLDSLTDGKNLASTFGRVPVLTTADFADQAVALNLKNARLQGYSANFDKSSGTAPRRTPSAPAPAPAPITGLGATAGDQSKDSPTDRDQLVRAAAQKATTCAGPRIDGTRSYSIVLDLVPAVLVVHPASAGTQLVEAWSCDGTKVLTFTIIPAK